MTIDIPALGYHPSNDNMDGSDPTSLLPLSSTITVDKAAVTRGARCVALPSARRPGSSHNFVAYRAAKVRREITTCVQDS